jgi:hypothetical protein
MGSGVEKVPIDTPRILANCIKNSLEEFPTGRILFR